MTNVFAPASAPPTIAHLVVLLLGVTLNVAAAGFYSLQQNAHSPTTIIPPAPVPQTRPEDPPPPVPPEPPMGRWPADVNYSHGSLLVILASTVETFLPNAIQEVKQIQSIHGSKLLGGTVFTCGPQGVHRWGSHSSPQDCWQHNDFSAMFQQLFSDLRELERNHPVNRSQLVPVIIWIGSTLPEESARPEGDCPDPSLIWVGADSQRQRRNRPVRDLFRERMAPHGLEIDGLAETLSNSLSITAWAAPRRRPSLGGTP